MGFSQYKKDFQELLPQIRERALLAFNDDLGNEGDITTKAALGLQRREDAKAVIIAEEPFCLAGAIEARAILEKGGITISSKEGGEHCAKGDIIMELSGPIDEILARERVALNYLTRMSGIATMSRRIARKHGKRVAFLRKTDPCLSLSEKYAVSLGGCLPHRLNLSDGLLIKDNHLDEIAKAAGSRLDAIHVAIYRTDAWKKKTGLKYLPIELEVDSVEEAHYAAIELSMIPGKNIILLDNFNVRDSKRAVSLIRAKCPEAIIEASGGITEESIKEYLGVGVDFVSGSMFLSAPPTSLKLEIL